MLTVFEAEEASRKCTTQRCLKQTKAYKVAEKEWAEKARALGDDMMAQKITMDEMMVASKKLLDELARSKAAQDRLACSLSKCTDHARRVVAAYADALKLECSTRKNPKACENLKKARAILRKKNISVDDMTVLKDLLV